MQQFSERAAGWINRCHAAAETMRCTRYVYTAAAWIALWRRTAHLSRGFDVGNVDKNINRRIDGKSDDIGHKRRPIQYLAGSHKRDRIIEQT
jgi:hypothetical protein